MPNSQNTNLTQSQLEVGAIITDGLRELRGAERAVERAQDRLNNSTKSFNARMHEAGAESRDFKLATASSDAVYNFYRGAVIASLPKADQAAISGKACEAKTALLRYIGARMGAIGKALARMEALAAGTKIDGRTKKARAAKAETAKGKAQSTAQDMTPASGTATEADSVLPPQIRDPRMVGLLNMIAQLSIEDQAKCYEVMVKAYDVFLTKSITKK